MIAPLPLQRTPRARPCAGDRRGFTLIEVLVALAVLAISLLSVIRAVTSTLDTHEGVRLRTMAGWVAEDRLALHRAMRDWPAPGVSEGVSEMGDVSFSWKEKVEATPNIFFRRMDVQVFADGRELASFSGVLSKQ